MRILVAATLTAALTITACHTAHSQIPSDLHHFIQSEATNDWDNDGRVGLMYQVASVNLHPGGTEYLVYWTGPGACGSGGCSMDIIERHGKAFHVITSTTITRLPIRVLDSQTKGWHDIGVFVAGGGIISGYEARLRFNGKRYPSNPSAQPDSHHAAGRTVLSESTRAVSLLPSAH